MSALAHLTKPQWDAALSAARQLCRGNVHDANDRAAFRMSRANLEALLPDNTDVRPIITAAVRWDALNSIAGAFAGMPASQFLQGEIA